MSDLTWRLVLVAVHAGCAAFAFRIADGAVVRHAEHEFRMALLGAQVSRSARRWHRVNVWANRVTGWLNLVLVPLALLG